ncbi:peptide chain release factor-like protein [Rhizobacter sp. SG703]|uniref:peptide chain release factor-like protein n=1 Tax=Rhizobacter sp. SG703 TaxID=2587140 RepID=UPI001444B9C8|nr:peptide chain release factor-like protein [Rhizobacter sp. SG703]NKI94967.1 protein subunit release factor B [Rhizobacter sp. SG703]
MVQMANAYIEFQVGDPSAAGWMNLFLRRCIGEPGSRFRFDFIDANDPAHSVVKVNGEGAYAFLAEELAKSGASRPPSVTVSLLESIDEDVFPLDPADIEATWFRDPSKTDGGFVAHTDACARLVHAASGMVAQCTQHRSRARNHAEALSLLRARVVASQHLFSTAGAVARKLTESDLPALQSFRRPG